MTDPLSLAAGSFAVVGVVDVVLRASGEVYKFLSEIKDAPAEVEQLRYCVQETTLLVHTSKQYLEEIRLHTSSASTSAADMSRALGLFTSAVRALDRELSALIMLAKKFNGVRRSWEKVKWFLDQRKLSNSLRKLENAKSMLSSALIFVGMFVNS